MKYSSIVLFGSSNFPYHGNPNIIPGWSLCQISIKDQPLESKSLLVMFLKFLLSYLTMSFKLIGIRKLTIMNNKVKAVLLKIEQLTGSTEK